MQALCVGNIPASEKTKGFKIMHVKLRIYTELPKKAQLTWENELKHANILKGKQKYGQYIKFDCN